MKKKYWYAFTRGGSIAANTKAKTKRECIEKLLIDASHMPYRTWENFRKFGYTVERLELDI